ncbi:MAG: phage portal protein, partial [Candidatus Eisenbacteria sp.]|nr:phage portal protein [Candidatus Eisenbacteria bacterium]
MGTPFDLKSAIYDSADASAQTDNWVEQQGQSRRDTQVGVLEEQSAMLTKSLDQHKANSRISNIVGTLINPKDIDYAYDKGRMKPTIVDHMILRRLSYACEPIRVAIEYRKTQMRMAKWRVVLVDEKAEPTDEQTKKMKEIEGLLKRKNRNKDTLSRTLEKAVDDTLVLDAGAIQIVPSVVGGFGEFVAMDGATIRPLLDRKGVLDKKTPYLQMLNHEVLGRFGPIGMPAQPKGKLKKPSLLYIMQNPTTHISMAGYGVSTVEMLITAVTALVHGARFNADYFYGPKIPEGLLYLGSAATQEDTTYFRYFWEHEMLNGWSLPIMGGGYRPDITHAPTPPQFVPFHRSPKDMQFHEYLGWLTRLVCAAFQIPLKEIGLADHQQQGGALFQASDQPARDTSTDFGLKPLLTLVAGEVTDVVQHFWGDEFKFEFNLDHKKDDTASAGRAKTLTDAGYFYATLWSENEKRNLAGLDPLDERQWQEIEQIKEKAKQEALQAQQGAQGQPSGDGGGGVSERPKGEPPTASGKPDSGKTVKPAKPVPRRPDKKPPGKVKAGANRVAKALSVAGMLLPDQFDDAATEEMALEWEAEIRRILRAMVDAICAKIGTPAEYDIPGILKSLPPGAGKLPGELGLPEIEKLMDGYVNGIMLTVKTPGYVEKVAKQVKRGVLRHPQAIYTVPLDKRAIPKAMDFPARAFLLGQRVMQQMLRKEGWFSAGARTRKRPLELNWLREYSFGEIRGQCQKVKTLIRQTLLAEREVGRHPFLIRQKLLDKTGDYGTDFRRIARTEVARAQSQAAYQELLDMGEEQCTFDEVVGACEACRTLLENRTFYIREIMHATNYGKRRKDW